MPLKWKYDQSEDLRWRVWSDATREGVCFALSAQFIICTANGINFVKWLKPAALPANEEGEKPAYGALADRIVAQHEISNTIIPRMAEQRRRVKAASESDGARVRSDYLVDLIQQNTSLRAQKDEDGVSFDPLPSSRRGTTVAGWADALSKSNGMKYISISGLLKGKPFAHGIAGIVANNQWGIFDPNFGIYGADNPSAFQEDLVKLFDVNYAKRQGLAMYGAQFATFV